MHAILLYFLNLFRPYPQKMTVLFLQKEALCLAAFAKGRSETYEIQRYAAAALPPPLSGKKRWDDPGAMAALIREICQHKGIPLKALAIVLSHGDGFLSQLELPELPEKEWKDAVLWEALQYVPYEEGTFGPVLEVMGKKGSPLSALIAAAPLVELEFFECLADMLSCCLVKIEPMALSLGRLLPETERGTALVLSREGTGGTLTAYEKGLPIASETWDTLPSAKVYGPYYEKEKAAGLSPEEEAQRWKSQVKHLTSYLDEAMELSFTDLFVWGEKEAEDAFLSTLAEVTSLAVHNFPSSGFGMAAERFEQAHWKLDRQKILPLLGAAQKGSPPYYLDLQAGRDKEKWLPRRFIEPLTRALAAMTCVLAVFLFSSHLYLVHEKKQLLEQKRAISLWKDRLFQHRRTEQSIHTLTEILSEAEKRTLSWHTLLTELGTSLPSECVLESVEDRRSSKGAILEIRGKTRKRQPLFIWTKDLSRLPAVKKVTLGDMEGKDSQDKTGKALDFTVLIHLEKGRTHDGTD